MQSTYLFYDIESTGLNKCFDQVLQFAAIRTDPELNELERHEIRIKLNNDVLPAPMAILTHRIGIEQMQAGRSELSAIEEIHALLNTPGTISVGYNTLGFDDEFLRFSFHKNLLPPYTHQYASQCGRMDIFPMTVMTYLFNREALEWPTINGKVSLKLEHLNAANQLASGQAHDAMVDVIATLNLARKLKQDKDRWDYMLGYFDKNTDINRISTLEPCIESNNKIFRQAILVQSKLGATNIFHAPVIELGQHQQYKNKTLWLRLDLPDLDKSTIDNIADHTFVISKKAGEQDLLLPTHPRFMKHLSEERREIFEHNKQWLQNNLDIFFGIVKHHQNYEYQETKDIDVDASLYTMGFPSFDETSLFKNFHKADLTKKIQMLGYFKNPHRRTQAIRILGRNYYKNLPADIKKEYQQYLEKLHDEKGLVDFRGQHKNTYNSIKNEIKKLLEEQSLDEQQQRLLNEYQQFMSKTLTEASTS